MKLYASERSQLGNGRKAWQCGHVAIPHFEVEAIDDDENVRIGLWLPTSGELNTSVRYFIIINIDLLPLFIREFKEDPEGFAERHFSGRIPFDVRTKRSLKAQDYSSDDEPKQRRAKVSSATVELGSISF